mgnify:CR=1 FL=1
MESIPKLLAKAANLGYKVRFSRSGADDDPTLFCDFCHEGTASYAATEAGLAAGVAVFNVLNDADSPRKKEK